MLMNSKAITSIQSLILTAVVIVAAVGGCAAYVLLNEPHDSSEIIKIGVLADLGTTDGDNAWQGVIFAAEQINAEGGILGKKVEVFGEDHDILSGADMLKVSSALTRLITYDKVDFIIGGVSGEAAFVCQDIASEHEKIFLAYAGTSDALTQRVLDDYDKYKYYFKVGANASSISQGIADSRLLLKESTGFNKVGYIAEDLTINNGIIAGMEAFFSEANGFDLVYTGRFPLGTVDFSSYFAAAEAAGTEVLIPLIGSNGAIPFVKEYHDRQSPMIIYGGSLSLASYPESWEWANGKCEYIVVSMEPVTAGHPLTSKTLPAREDYINRWDETPTTVGARAYDIMRFILIDAIERAGTIETDAVIEALEETSIETSLARNFVFTESHATMMGENPNNPEDDYMITILYQWVNGKQIPVYPQEIMEEAGATYTFPDWAGPWDEN